MKILTPTIFLLLTLLTSSSHSAVLNLTSQELIVEQQAGVVIIDIRTPKEWVDTGTIKNVAKIMFFNQQRKAQIAEFMTAFEKLVTSKDRRFILVCRSGSRTKAVINFLDQKLGYTNGAHLAKGMKQWIAEQREVEQN